jgi:protein O-GlcNAc transferase
VPRQGWKPLVKQHVQANRAKGARISLSAIGRNTSMPQSPRSEAKLPPVSDLFHLALLRHENNQLDEAQVLYQQILQLDPQHPGALHYSGLVAHQKGNSARAISLMTSSIEIDPCCPNYFVNLGLVFASLCDFDNASAHYRKAIALDPHLASAHHELGNALRHQGNLVEAAKSYSQELTLAPEAYESINTLGSVLNDLGSPEQAIACYRKSLELSPAYADAHNNLGLALDHLGRPEEAIASYRAAIQHNPTLAAAHSNLGKTLNLLRHFPRALHHCERSVDLQPELKEAHLNLGNALKGLGCLNAAARAYRTAIALNPNYAGAHNNLAEVLKDQGNLQAAVESFETALHCTPPGPNTYSNLLCLYAFTRHISLQAERLIAQGWENAFLTEDERLAARRRSSPTSGAFPPHPRADRKLRLGILSAEALSTHAVSYFLDPFLKELDRTRFDLTLFLTQFRAGADAERVHQHLNTHPDRVISMVTVSDTQAATLIRSEHIDVLIETTGHTYGSRLGILAHRAAPVQCSYIGYWSTTGLTEMDWYIAGTGCDPSFDEHFTEGLWRLPRLAHCYAGDVSLPDSAWAPDPNGTIWLGSFNKNSKIREQTLGLWAKALHALPEAKLLLEDDCLKDDETHHRIRSTLATFGIKHQRVEFIPYVSGHERHMQLYDRLDIALDTIPFNSGTTAFDALWMGVPLVTLKGDWFGATLGGSAVTALNHPEWLANNADEFAAIVRSLARDVEGRKYLRKNQRARMADSELCDAKDLARSLEDACNAMYDRWLNPPPIA